jgi:ABC-2 type transport system permease protein
MRWRMVANSVRSVQGAFELGARSIAFILYTVMGLGMAAGLGAAGYGIASSGKWQFLPLLFWGVFAVWQVLPIALASFQEQFDLSGLLRFPVDFPSFYLLHLVFGLVDIPALLGGFCCLGIGVGIIAATPDRWGATVLALVVFAVFNILLARAILAWIDRWLAQRRTREIVSGLFLLVMLSLQLLNPALRQNAHFQRPRGHAARRSVFGEMPPWARKAGQVLPWTPPGLAASVLAPQSAHQAGSSLESLGLLGIYILATGAALGVRLKGEFSGENFGEAPMRKVTGENDRKWLIDGSGPIAAVFEKELRTIPRSMPLLFAMGGPLVSVLVIASLFRNGASATGIPFLMAFPICVSYALLGFMQMIYNSLGAEGTGIQILFLSPTPIRKVLLAKNLFHGMLFWLVALVAGVFTVLRMGMPSGILLATTAAWLAFALPANLAAGNLLSLTMPYRVNLGKLSRQRGSQASALLSLLIQLGILAVGGGVALLCAHFGKTWFAVPSFLILAGVMVLVWLRVLSNADAMANRNRENLIGKLAKTE